MWNPSCHESVFKNPPDGEGWPWDFTERADTLGCCDPEFGVELFPALRGSHPSSHAQAWGQPQRVGVSPSREFGCVCLLSTIAARKYEALKLVFPVGKCLPLSTPALTFGAYLFRVFPLRCEFLMVECTSEKLISVFPCSAAFTFQYLSLVSSLFGGVWGWGGVCACVWNHDKSTPCTSPFSVETDHNRDRISWIYFSRSASYRSLLDI